ncbi:prolipoprotein diacylglyceryl transferase [Desulfarculus baarsii DSM 2075]|uniref:Phosphatidylglycerol--prolipoprotein diacylglyceryl transferase n=1 Tax=Desulfarculus baarsii (strain ATCC 33931 / DSM 2075 / LMG 7858 / VKM B-1802 / 2st14) TaxID=644282 RepID=E1QE00_DESB2|nr:prolipoprotein diacylglyceryl transferase [Desulfarculus baarsii]ADK83786.1 prolipoprotein diacylglyceryl transferase [Desulfarculus baarsii DSM 2075]
MRPILLQLGPITLYGYGLMVALGTAVAMWVGVRFVRRDGLDLDACVNVGVATALAGLLGARAFYYLIEWESLSHLPWYYFFFFWEGGLVFYGCLAVGLPTAIVLARHYHLPLPRLLDIGAPALAIGQAIGRVGCFLAGCCHGLPWPGGACAVVFTDPHSLAPRGVELHPTQLYTSAALLLIFGALIWLWPRRRFYGQIFFSYAVLHAVARIIIEQFRGDFRGEPICGAVTPTAFFAGCLALAGVVALIWLWRKQGRHRSEQ